MVDIARRAVAATAHIAIRTVGLSDILAGLLNGAFYAQFLHIFIGRNFAIDKVAFGDYGYRQSHNKERNCADRNEYNYYPRWHKYHFFVFNFCFSEYKCIHLWVILQECCPYSAQICANGDENREM